MPRFGKVDVHFAPFFRSICSIRAFSGKVESVFHPKMQQRKEREKRGCWRQQAREQYRRLGV